MCVVQCKTCEPDNNSSREERKSERSTEAIPWKPTHCNIKMSTTTAAAAAVVVVSLQCVLKNRILTIFRHNFAKTSWLWIIFGRRSKGYYLLLLPKNFGRGRESPA